MQVAENCLEGRRRALRVPYVFYPNATGRDGPRALDFYSETPSDEGRRLKFEVREYREMRALADFARTLADKGEPSDTRGWGCGIWPLLLKRTIFVTACIWHDRAYTIGSWAQLNLSRYETDRWFLRQMLYLADQQKRCRRVRRGQAWAFYVIARAAGARWWEGER